MKLILENWKKLLEGEVIDFPHSSAVSQKDTQRVIALDDAIGKLLANIYGNQAEIPIDVLELMEELVTAVEGSLKK